ncbi:MAG: hypothetical protein J0L93_06660 [Deltaproteobacteria bacterium]|nr:hypothetical protein [Deltaproteobacteria bacterium]
MSATSEDILNPQSEIYSAYANVGRWYWGLQSVIFSHDKFVPLREIFSKRPEEIREFRDGLDLHAAALMKIFVNLNLQDLLIEAIQFYIEKDLKLQMNFQPLNPKTEQNVKELSEIGYTHLDSISLDKVEAMNNYLKNLPARDWNNNPIVGKPTEVQNVGGFHLKDVIACPHLLEIANDPKILSVVRNYLGAAPTIIVASAFQSFAGKNQARDAQLFHMDYDDYKFCKLFVYLTDVDEKSGPHVYLDSTHKLQVMAQKRGSFSKGIKAFDEWWIMKLRKTDEEVKEYLGITPTKITGKAGSAFLVDTRGIHKGLLPENRDRMICQITYAVSPRIQEHITLLPVSNPVIPPAMKNPTSEYVSRLFINFQK